MKQYISGTYSKLRRTRVASNFFNLSGIQLSNILLTLLIFPIIARIVGLEAFGYITLASTFSILIGTFINFGTNETGIRDVASNIKEPEELSKIVYNVFWMRLIIFCLYLLCLLIFHRLFQKYILFISLSIPIAAAELLNPLFFYIGVEKLKLCNISNLLSNLLSVVCILLFIKGPQDAQWVNLILGSSSVLSYCFLLVTAVIKYRLHFNPPNTASIKATVKHNSYLTANSISIQLQQSLMIFALGAYGNKVLLGAYAVCDKVIRSARTMSVTLSSAMYPRCAQTYNADHKLWDQKRKQWKIVITIAFFAGSVLIFIFADFIIRVLSKERNDVAIVFLRLMALVPTISALNCLNTIDQLVKKKTVNIFRIAVIILALAVFLTFVLFKVHHYVLYGAFTLIIETCVWLLYEFAVNKTSVSNA